MAGGAYAEMAGQLFASLTSNLDIDEWLTSASKEIHVVSIEDETEWSFEAHALACGPLKPEEF